MFWTVYLFAKYAIDTHMTNPDFIWFWIWFGGGSEVLSQGAHFFVYVERHCCGVGHWNIVLYMVRSWCYIANSC